MKIQREELIRKLESVQPGLAVRETIEQSSTFVFYHGDVHTLNDEVYCRCPSGLDPKAKAAVPAGERAYMEGVPHRQRLSAFFLTHPEKPPKTLDFANVAQPNWHAVSPDTRP